MNKKNNPVCDKCTGWLHDVTIGTEKWVKCGSCGYMRRNSKRKITPLPKSV